MIQTIFRRASVNGLALLVSMLGLSSCASVPQEVVELSYVIGRDVEALQDSYRTLVRTHFDGLRKQADTFIDTRWKQTYLRIFIVDGGLVAVATDDDPDEVLRGVELWTRIAIEEIDSKRHELIDPIDRIEEEHIIEIDRAFGQVIRANAVVTAHLNSLREVKEVQDEILDLVDARDLRDSITNALIDASRATDQAIREIEVADRIIDRF